MNNSEHDSNDPETSRAGAIGRRSVLIAGAGALATAALGGTASAATPRRTPTSGPTAVPAGSGPASETAESSQLAALYQAAVAEGGKLTVYAGGDTPTQQDQTKQAFAAQFPGVDLHLVVDLSKVHDARFDAQVDANNVVVDVLELQSLDDFPRWKREGSLLRYRPLGFDQVDPRFKDPEGYYTGVVVLAFANVVATSLGATVPVEAEDFLRPDLKNQLIFTYPNDDDAVLYYFHQLVQRYGWNYLDRLIAQNPTFVRGTAASAGAVYAGAAKATFATFSGLQSAPTDSAKFTLPAHSPFVSWAQTAAIPTQAPHKAAAKLYLSWLLSTGFQSSGQAWSPRRDIPTPHGYRAIFNYPNTNPTGLLRFLQHRDQLDRFRARLQLYVGDVTGPSPTGTLGFTPGTF